MESITKNRQSETTLLAMVERAYGPDRTPDAGSGWFGELGHGWFNVAYRIRLRDGAEVVLKIAPPADVEVMSYERGAMRTELAALELVRERTSVPVPPVDHADLTHELCDADYFFMPFVDADNLGIVKSTMPADEAAACMTALGRANRELNGIRGDRFGPLAGPGHPTWRAAFGAMAEDVLRDGERRAVDVGWGYDELRAVFAEHADALDEVVEPRYVEWDLWDGNALVRDGEVVCVIDHERAFYGDPLIEAGFTGTVLPAFGDPEPFLRGYGRGAPTGGEVARRRLYCLHLVLVMAIEAVHRGHADTTQHDWARERITEVMGLLGRAR
ncbi:aminoglycoside phosphotransferase family protein [Actinosynnema pretiosum subsp. pretiosum]|uniref:Aminoglycoside phosphotransferase family protein n=1 Tax=Actinosynnema pretiosum subsp. pretiosum TaxID=103721 RepID=A0AA45L7P9_9PSEU|nr:hypothetical protein APASM_4269 [Actinosynnema pretiosum subsp. pretiosum]QUF04345.1 aminoglycoside phosphotransferase family protein [Actinosynnema pretiosum subsp. pretiosum]